jgi:hypothetical protein
MERSAFGGSALGMTALRKKLSRFAGPNLILIIKRQMKTVLHAIYKRRVILICSGFLLLILCSVFYPFDPVPRAEKDAQGYYFRVPRTNQKHYSDDARKNYYMFHLTRAGVCTGLGVVILVGVVWVLVKIFPTTQTNGKESQRIRL